jgi:hypothetical protein
MRVMVLVKANKDTEAGVMPSTEPLAAMGSYNEELVKAGVKRCPNPTGEEAELEIRPVSTWVGSGTRCGSAGARRGAASQAGRPAAPPIRRAPPSPWPKPGTPSTPLRVTVTM